MPSYLMYAVNCLYFSLRAFYFVNFGLVLSPKGRAIELEETYGRELLVNQQPANSPVVVNEKVLEQFQSLSAFLKSF